MKRFFSLWFLFIFSFSATFAEEFTPPELPKTKIIVLGTYHMANPGLDSFNMETDDVLLAERQKEIQEVIDMLAAFKPTKILVEANWDSTKVVEDYKAFLRGELDLTRNETHQIGFRLAKKLNHPSVYPVDYRMSMAEGVDEQALSRLFPTVEEDLNAYGQSYKNYQSEKLESSSIGEFLALMNTKAMINANHYFYLAYDMKVGEGGEFAGPELVANWYKRNILILHNIMRVAEKGDRLLVIFGQGHAKILNQLLDDSPYFEREDVLDYLPAPAK